jgi:hypothetical protein
VAGRNVSYSMVTNSSRDAIQSKDASRNKKLAVARRDVSYSMVTNNGRDANQSKDACCNRTPAVAGRDSVTVWSPTTVGTPTKVRMPAATGRQLWQGGTQLQNGHQQR